MKNPGNNVKVVLVVSLFVLLLSSVRNSTLAAADETPNISGQAPLTVKVIEINLAVFVAEDYLLAFYPGDWVVFDRLVSYGLDGTPAAYFIVFRDPSSPIKTPQELSNFLERTFDKQDDLLKQIEAWSESEDLSEEQKTKLLKDLRTRVKRLKSSAYLVKDFATVITGAMEESPPIIRCYKGLPEILIKKAVLKRELAVEHRDKKLRLGRIIYLDPLDIQFEVVANPTQQETIISGSEAVGQSPIQESYIMPPKEKRLIRMKTLRKKLKGHSSQKEKTLAKMNDEQRRSLKQAEKAKKAHRISQWEKFRSQYQDYVMQQAEEGKSND